MIDHNAMDYIEIAKRLNLDKEKDRAAAELLDSLIQKHDPGDDIRRISALIKGKNVVVFGAGPSLKKDIQEIKRHQLNKERSFVFIAADGAAKALLEEGIMPHIQVTDLDGYIDTIRFLNKKGCLTIVHGHGDNRASIKDVVPKLEKIIGTTQTDEFGALHNFGGFTDGDRAVYLAEKFSPKLIILAGMDYGKNIGLYSGRYDLKTKLIKLDIGKRLLEELARGSDTVILNMTSGGEDLLNIPRITAEHLLIITT